MAKLTFNDLLDACPRHGKFRNGPRSSQIEAMQKMGDTASDSLILEGDTGVGKTLLMFAYLRAQREKLNGQAKKGTFFLIVPTKALAEQVLQDFPEAVPAFGRHEHPCLFSKEDFDPDFEHPVTEGEVPDLAADLEVLRADEIPCTMLRNCPHRVSQETGETHALGASRCPYYQQKYEAKTSGRIVVATHAFYLFAVLFSQEFELAAVAIDEAHRIGQVVRYCLSYEITDWHITKLQELLGELDMSEAAKTLKQFKRAFSRMCKTRDRVANREMLLSEEEISRLLMVLEDLDADAIQRRLDQAINAGQINLNNEEDLTLANKMKMLIHDIRRYVHLFQYSLTEKDEEGEVTRRPLNYSCTFFRAERTESQRWQYKLVIRCHLVAPLIRKRLLAPNTLAASATIGDVKKFGYETGISAPKVSVTAGFPAHNRRFYLPTDVPDLRFRAQGSERNKKEILRRIARACRSFASRGHRSLVVVISNEEKEKFLEIAHREKVDVISYGGEVTSKAAATLFRNGDGDVLLGTAGVFAEGLDLPGDTARAIFFLRPGNPNPNDAATQFEEKRFEKWKVQALRQWRLMLQALQVSGRNVRGMHDKGVCFFCSSQFRKFLYGSLPEYMQPAYRGQLRWNDCIKDAVKLFE